MIGYMLKKFINNYVALKKSLQPNKYLFNKVFDKYQIIFIHVPKTGGLSVLASLVGSNFKVGHKKATQFRDFDPVRFHQYFKFGFARNPLDRFFSAYCFLRKGGLGGKDAEFGQKYIQPYANFQAFVKALDYPKQKEKILQWRHFKPQYHFLCDKNEAVLVDYLGYYESLKKDYQNIAHRLSMGSPLRLVNSSDKPAYEQYYNENMKRVLKNIYYKDFEIFGY